ncbi:MAG: SidA/IucD/PvdA family monooxygenase, partial [Myxococcales bacterium]|nr:SidA/IucD/PvdA family monooxygenase [Myxococcales bacterium]
MTHRTRRVAVIGAGLSGLVAIKELLDEGHQVDAFEAAGREGGVFASTTGVSYDQMRLTVSQHFMAFSSMTPPPDEPRAFWTRERYLIYLRAFCERFDLLRHIRFETRVTAIQRLPDGTMRVCWSTGGPGEAETQGARIYDAVAICQGAFRASAPRLPCIPGLADFPGRVTHSAAYVGPKPFAGQRVLVIGMGETAADVTSQIAAQAAHCWLTFRTYPELVARFPYGHAHTTDAWSARINHWLPHARLTEFRAATDLDAAYGPLPDRHRLVEDWAVRSGGARFLQKNDDFVPQVLSGEIDVAPGGVERIEGGVVHLADGRKVEPDDIVLCTGYRESSIPAEWLDGVQVDGFILTVAGDLLQHRDQQLEV